MMDVTIVGGNLPYPPTAGNRIRTLNLTLRLARRHRITLIFHRSDDVSADREAIAFLRDHGVETIGVGKTIPPKSGPRFFARLAANLASPLPYSVASHNSPTLVQTILGHAARGRVDLWQAEWTPYMKSLRALGDVRTVIMAHNVESLIWKRYYEIERNPLKRWFIGQQWRKFERFERQAFAEATRVVAVSREDADLIRRGFGVGHVDVVDNGIDRNYFGHVVASRDPKRILFLGGFDWRPNLDAVGRLLDRIFPAILAAEPTARLCLVGRNPPEALVRRARALPNVELHANVPDVRPFLAGCGVMAVPLRIGGGSRLKILEALACGLPVVSTRIGAEGLRLTPGEHIEVVDTEEGMAAALLGCIRDPNSARPAAERGRQAVLDRYDWDALADDLERSWARCLETAAGVP
jgi:glycosyltransferase involved in cell wall biosynthesis